LPDALLRFLQAGDQPIVFTLGTTVARLKGMTGFCDTMVAAARALDRRLVLAVSDAMRDELLRRPLDGSTFVAGYVDYGALFPHAAAIVHHGGMGTIGQALRAGVPMLITPFVSDQHHNAELARQLGIARTVPVHDRDADRIMAELSALLDDDSYRHRAREVAEVVRTEDGAIVTCDLIEKRFGEGASGAGTQG
jgi:UDP:flavonoid glycosyltransferase YjiC (YdhE family)